MIHAYDKLYLEKARIALGRMLDYAVYDLGQNVDSFFQMFLNSGMATRFEVGDCSVLAGMSGVELAYEVLERSGFKTKHIKPRYVANRSIEYWTGWALAYYQWETSMRFVEITTRIPVETVVELYDPYHEMDIRQFTDKMNQLYGSAK